MGYEKAIDLWCNGEPCWSGTYLALTDDLEEARRLANRSGWSYNPETDEDFCRKCTKIREGN